MKSALAAPGITQRIMGDWEQPGEMMERLPEGFKLTPEALILPGGESLEFVPKRSEEEFAQIFRSSCRGPLSPQKEAWLSRSRVNLGLNGRGGSFPAALKLMRAGAAIVQAGGAGVFIDNSLLAHGGTHWRQMAADGGQRSQGPLWLPPCGHCPECGFLAINPFITIAMGIAAAVGALAWWIPAGIRQCDRGRIQIIA